MSNDKIKRFPFSSERNRRLNTKNRVVPCLVSERWLQFPEKVHVFTDGGYLSINVMTKTFNDNGDSNNRKLCELVLIKEDLEAMLEELNKNENKK